MKPIVTIHSPKLSPAILRRYIESTVNDKFFSIEFVKADGSLRILNGRLGVKKHLKGGNCWNDINKYLTVYDVGSRGYRNVSLTNVKAFTVDNLRHLIGHDARKLYDDTLGLDNGSA